MKKKFTLGADSFGEEEIEAAIQVLRSGSYTMGEKVKSYEKSLAEWLGVKETVMVNSGSSANLLLVDCLIRRSDPVKAKLKPGDEVIVPALSWPTTVWPIIQLGLVPVFADSDPVTLAIDLNSAASVVTPKTKAMFLIHVLGRACEMGPYQKFCNDHGMTLIEDCCESLGAYNQGQHVGSFGLGGTLSHFFSHHLTTMEGGVVFTNDSDLADDLRSQRAHGWIRDRHAKENWTQKYPALDPRFLFVLTGYNLRPMEIQAAIGMVQLKRLDSFLEIRRKLALRVAEIVKPVSWLQLISGDVLEPSPTKRAERKHSWMNFPFILKTGAPALLQEVKNILESEGVDTRAIIAGNLLEHPVMKNFPHRQAKSMKVANEILEKGFMIGCHTDLDEERLSCLVNAVKRFAAAMNSNATDKYLVVLPSYNEKENLVSLVDAILAQGPHFYICVVDDNSPDGTAKLVEEHIKKIGDAHLKLIVRGKKDGRGGAVRRGFEWGKLESGHQFKAFIEMDCDFSHRPEDLKIGIAKLDQYSVVVGARYPDGEIRGWPWRRKALSFFANLLARVLISWKVGDYTNGFRFYTSEAVDVLLTCVQRHKGYIYLSETLAELLKRGFSVGAFPILFVNRERGVSNTNFQEVFSAFKGIFEIAREYRARD